MGDGAPDHLGLLVDFLGHEVAVVALSATGAGGTLMCGRSTTAPENRGSPRLAATARPSRRPQIDHLVGERRQGQRVGAGYISPSP
jgi:hypothetical protein